VLGESAVCVVFVLHLHNKVSAQLLRLQHLAVLRLLLHPPSHPYQEVQAGQQQIRRDTLPTYPRQRVRSALARSDNNENEWILVRTRDLADVVSVSPWFDVPAGQTE